MPPQLGRTGATQVAEQRALRLELGLERVLPTPRGPAVTTCRDCGWHGPGICRHPSTGMTQGVSRSGRSGERLG